MRKQKYLFNELLLRYNKYRRKLQRLEVTGSNVRRQGILRKHIDRLYGRLHSIYASIKLGTAAVAMTGAMIMTAPDVQAQESPTFQTGQVNPFGLEDIGVTTKAILVDIDEDGDLDIFASQSDGEISFFRNTGSVSAPSFGAEEVNPFGIIISEEDDGYHSIDFKDLDNDGDFDMMLISHSDDFRFYENKGTSSSPAFDEGIVAPFGLTDVNFYYGRLAMADLDGDGDFDLMSGDSYDPLRFYENIGTSTSPQFTTAVYDPFGLEDGEQFGYFTDFSFVDLDEDGDLDIFISANNKGVSYYENVGSSTSPDFAEVEVQTDPFRLALVDVGKFLLPYPGDLDGDGDLDLLSGSQDGNFHFFENRFLNFETVESQPFGLPNRYYNATPALVDIDGDGDLDLFSGAFNAELFYFENTGTPNNPSFSDDVSNPFSIDDAEFSNYMIPSFVDIDDDGDYDLFMGGGYDFLFYENEGDANTPAFGEAEINPFGFQVWSGDSYYTFADLDNDGDYDLLRGNSYGNFYYHPNTGTSTTPDFSEGTNSTSLLNDIGTDSRPVFIDIDKDGDYDVLSGEKDGNFYLFENQGTSTMPEFGEPIINPIGLNFDYNLSSPSFGDLDGDGDEDLMIGDRSGVFRFFEFTGPVFTSANETSLDENIATAMTVEAADGVEEEDYTDLAYSILGGVDAALFSIDAVSGALSFITLPDFESPHDANQDNVYEVSIRVYSAEMESANVQDLTITITDETPSVTLTVIADDQSKNEGEENPTFTISYTGFLTGDDESSLDVVPVATTDATTTSEAGTYVITVSGGESEDRYIFDYVDGILTINEALGLLDEQHIRVYPNPVVNELAVSDHQVSALVIYDLKGAKVLETIVDGTVDVSGLEKGVYMIQLRDSDSQVVYSGRIIKD